MANEAIDNDYSLSRVPEGAKQPLWQILMIRIGAICCVSQLVLGATLGYGMSFWGAFWATMLGSVILQVVSWALGTAAAREGLSTSLLSRWCVSAKMVQLFWAASLPFRWSAGSAFRTPCSLKACFPSPAC